MVLRKNPASGTGEIMDKITGFFDKADRHFDQITKTIQKDRDKLRKEKNLENLAASLYLSFEKGLRKDLMENNVENEAQAPLLAIAKEAWKDKQMDRQAAEVLNSPELKGMAEFVSHIENLPKLKECIESADPKANWEIMLAGIFGENSGLSENVRQYFGPVLSLLGLDSLIPKDADEREENKTANQDDAKGGKPEGETQTPAETDESSEVRRETPKATCFVGDSNTLNMTRQAREDLKIDGNIMEKAVKGQGSEEAAKAAERMAEMDPSPLEGYENAVVLLGTNDLLTKDPSLITGYLERAYRALKKAGVKHIYAATIPPVGGYPRYDRAKARVKENRTKINEWIRKTQENRLSYQVIDLAAREKDGGMADNDDPEKLCRSAHSGDGVHFDKKMLARIYQRELEIGTGKASPEREPQNIA